MFRYSSLKPAEYFPRLLDKKIAENLKSSTVVELEGIYGCGKTYSALAQSQSVTSVNDRDILLPLLQSDARIALVGSTPHLIDEWCFLTSLRSKAYRRASKCGSFILASSCAIPPETDGTRLQKRTPQIARLTMRTLSLAEMKRSDTSVSLSGLFAHRFTPSEATSNIEQIASLICSGGWPRLFKLGSSETNLSANSQIEPILTQFLPFLGRKSEVGIRILQALVRLTGDDVSYQKIVQTMSKNGRKAPSRTTTLAYTRALCRLFLIEELSGWAAPIRSTSRVKTKPRFFATDPSIGAWVLRVHDQSLLTHAPLFHALFKTFVLHELRVYISVLPFDVQLYYYADADGLEVDFILLLADGQWAAINAEIGEMQVPSSLKRLKRLKKKIAHGTSQLGDPIFRALILASCDGARQDPQTHCYIFPLTTFGA